MWELDHKEGWVPKNWCLQTMVLEKTLQSPLHYKEIKSVLKKINPEYSLGGLMLKLKFQYLGHLIWRADSLEKTLMLQRLKAGGEGKDRGWDSWIALPTQWTWVWANSRRWRWTGKLGVLQSMGLQRVGHDLVTEQHGKGIQALESNELPLASHCGQFAAISFSTQKKKIERMQVCWEVRTHDNVWHTVGVQLLPHLVLSELCNANAPWQIILPGLTWKN